MVGKEIDSHPQRELRGPHLPFRGTGTVISSEIREILEPSTTVIERTNAAPPRTADWGRMASPVGPIVVDAGTPPSLGGLPEPHVRKNLFAAGPISPIVDQHDTENGRVGPFTPDFHGHLGLVREALALMQQAPSGTKQNPTVEESSPTPMSGSRRSSSLVEDSCFLGAYPKPPSGSGLNPTIIEASPTQIEADECDQSFPLVLEQGGNDEEEEIGVLECRALHHSPISVASSPALPEPVSGTRNRPMLVEKCPAPHYIMLEESLAPQYVFVEESPPPMSGVKDRPCLVVELSEPTEDRAGTTSPVPLSGTKDRPCLVDDSPAVPKVSNLCWGGGNPVEGGSATVPISLVPPLSTTSPMEKPQPRLKPNLGGGPEVATGSEPVFASHLRIQSPLVIHESPQYIVVDESPPPPHSRILLVLFPLRCHPAPARGLTSSTWTASRTWFGHFIVGVRGGTFLWWRGVCACCCAPHTPYSPCGGTLWPFRGWGGCWRRRLWVISSSGAWGSLVSTFWGPRSNPGGG